MTMHHSFDAQGREGEQLHEIPLCASPISMGSLDSSRMPWRVLRIGNQPEIPKMRGGNRIDDFHLINDWRKVPSHWRIALKRLFEARECKAAAHSGRQVRKFLHAHDFIKALSCQPQRIVCCHSRVNVVRQNSAEVSRSDKTPRAKQNGRDMKVGRHGSPGVDEEGVGASDSTHGGNLDERIQVGPLDV